MEDQKGSIPRNETNKKELVNINNIVLNMHANLARLLIRNVKATCCIHTGEYIIDGYFCRDL